MNPGLGGSKALAFDHAVRSVCFNPGRNRSENGVGTLLPYGPSSGSEKLSVELESEDFNSGPAPVKPTWSNWLSLSEPQFSHLENRGADEGTPKALLALTLGVCVACIGQVPVLTISAQKCNVR